MLWKDEELKQLTKNGQDDVDPVLDGNKAVWRRWDGHDYEIAYYTGLVSVQLTNDDMEKGPPMLSEGRVVWAARSGVQDDWEIYTYKAGKTVQVTKNSSQDVAPSVNGDTIIWRNNDAIFMAERTCK